MKLSKLFKESKNETIEISAINEHGIYKKEVKIKVNGIDYTKKLIFIEQTVNHDGYLVKLKMGD